MVHIKKLLREDRANYVWTLAARGSHSFWKGVGQAVVRLFDPNSINRAGAPMSRRHDEFVPAVNQKESEKHRDKLLLALLKTPPQPRPKRERGNAKPAFTKRAIAGKRGAIA
jgi:hypothetical protein